MKRSHELDLALTLAGLALAAGACATVTLPAAADPSTVVVRIAELQIDPAQLDAYKAALSEEIEASVRLEPGVLALNAVSINDNPTQIRLLEVYASQSAYEAHIQSPHFLKYKTSTLAMVKSLELISATPVRLCSKATLAVSGCGP